MAGGVLFTVDAADRIADAVEYVEGHYPGGRPPARRRPATSAVETFWARLTSGTADGNGNYPAVITVYDSSVPGWVDYGAVKVKPVNGETLTNAVRYQVQPAGVIGTDQIFTTVVQGPGGGGGTLTVTSLDPGTGDSTVSVSPVTTVEVDLLSGLKITNAAGNARLFAQDASLTHNGVVNQIAQSFEGVKTFRRNVTVGTGDDAGSAVNLVTGSANFAFDVTGFHSGGAVGYIRLGAAYSGVVPTSICDLQVDPVNKQCLLLGINGSTVARSAYCVQDPVMLGVLAGQWGSLLDGSVVSGGIITAIGAGGTLGDPVTVAHGGTGLATLTAHAVLLGEGVSPVAFASPGTAGYVLTSNGASLDPSFQALPAGSSLPDPVTPAHGGTGRTSLSANAVMLGEGTSSINFAMPNTSGYVLTDNGVGSDPGFQPLPAFPGATKGAEVLDATYAVGFTANTWGAVQTSAPADFKVTLNTAGTYVVVAKVLGKISGSGVTLFARLYDSTNSVVLGDGGAGGTLHTSSVTQVAFASAGATDINTVTVFALHTPASVPCDVRLEAQRTSAVAASIEAATAGTTTLSFYRIA